MMISVPSLISNLWKRPPIPVRTSAHMMAGLFQTIFLNQLGVPEFQISLTRLAGFFRIDSLILNIHPSEVDCHSVWIYEKRNKILFFRNKKLIFSFNWVEFKEKWKRSKEEIDFWMSRRSRARMVTSTSYIN